MQEAQRRAVQVYYYWVLSMWALETITVMISFAMSPSEVMRFYSESVISILSWTKFKVCFAFIYCESHRKHGEDLLKIKKLLTKLQKE